MARVVFYVYDKSIYLDNKFHAHDRHLTLCANLTKTRTRGLADNTMTIYVHYFLLLLLFLLW
jgi:hypothetical protein